MGRGRLARAALGGALATALGGGPAAAAAPAAPDAAAIDRRAEDILAQMTLDEKVGQLNLVSYGDFDWNKAAAGRVGAVINFNNPTDIARLQELARQSRLGIPVLFGLDVLHGFRTTFPVPLAEAASFDPEVARFAAEQAGREAAAVGVQWTYAPMADLSRDPRWGRIVEGSGEDPHLGRVFARARVEGFRAAGLATAAKHFAGYGASVGGRDYDATPIPRAEFRDAFLPPFRGAIEAGSETVMSAFNALDGVPATANPWLLTDVLRGELGFRGFVVSDWASIQELMNHGIAADAPEAARKALLAGVDMDLMSQFYDRHLADEVRAGRLPEAALDRAVRRVLRVKLGMGLFERPPLDPRAPDIQPTPETRAAARRVARETMVLLRNRDGALPLSAGRIAVVGPFAHQKMDQLGPHAARGEEHETVTVWEGIRARAESAGIEVAYAAACDLACERSDGFADALAKARQADVVVAVLGETRENSGEAASRTSLDFPGRQRELFEALAATGKPVVLVLMAGRPLELGSMDERAAAILMAWYPGTEGGPAVADVLFGDADPAGKLPLTWPRSVGQLPLYYNRLPTGRPPAADNRFTLGYVDAPLAPQYPFGWGLAYTRFEIADVALREAELCAADTLEVAATLRNVGARPGREVVQLYLRQPVAGRSRPIRELKAFAKVPLGPGEARRVTLRVPASELGYHLEDGTYVVEPGAFEVFVGPDSNAPLGATFRILDGMRRAPGRTETAAAEVSNTSCPRRPG